MFTPEMEIQFIRFVLDTKTGAVYPTGRRDLITTDLKTIMNWQDQGFELMIEKMPTNH